MGRLRLLFICLGMYEFLKANTCRSPMAECIMAHLVRKHQLNWICDSAALMPWNVGREPANRCQEVLKQNGLKTKHLGRMITIEDFQIFDYILCMDNWNLSELKAMVATAAPKCRATIRLLGSYLQNREREIIEDPFFSKGMGMFCNTFSHIHESCEMFIKQHRLDNGEYSDEPIAQIS